MKTELVTGGAGFIGSCYVLQARERGVRVINLDRLTYSGNLENLAALKNDPEHIFVHGDIGDEALLRELFLRHAPDAVVNFAAESHVDRSILDPEAFVRTNVLGTTVLLRVAEGYCSSLAGPARAAFRFLHVSTDEVFGALGPEDPAFSESTPYSPNSPYSASKAASDHFVRAFHETYGLPVLITNCSNNYGPRQFPEKLIPLTILNALRRKPLPVYGKGGNVRDWLHVADHCRAIALVLEKGRAGRSYAIGGRSEKRNIEVVREVCRILDRLCPHPEGPYESLVTFVKDRPGHDWRYAINCTRMEQELGWAPAETFAHGLEETVRWYLENEDWVRNVESGEYRNWLQAHYGDRIAAERATIPTV
jgi:dTDP-glucose 4,6-dehydratase